MALLLAHRGASFLAPENTLASFRLAQNLGAHGFETDLRRCATGELVLFHDHNPLRTTNYREIFPTRGRRKRPKAKSIGKLSWEVLSGLDAGTWKDERFRGEKIPRFEDLLQLAGKEDFLAIEVKTLRIRSDGLEQALLKALNRNQMKKHPLVIASFNPFFLKRFRHLTKDYAIGLISEVKPKPNRSRRIWVPILKPEYLMLQGHSKIGPEIASMHRQRRKVFLWTLDKEEEFRYALDAKADGIITNRPEIVRELPNDLASRLSRD